MSSAEGNVGVAFGLVCGAGAATALGASVVFFPSLVKLASRRILAASLGLSAGVMIYVSFAEIFIKSVDGFADYLKVDEEGIDEAEVERREDMAYIYATCSFFGGVLSMLVSHLCPTPVACFLLLLFYSLTYILASPTQDSRLIS